mgnify:CR=1 FL=1
MIKPSGVVDDQSPTAQLMPTAPLHISWVYCVSIAAANGVRDADMYGSGGWAYRVWEVEEGEGDLRGF